MVKVYVVSFVIISILLTVDNVSAQATAVYEDPLLEYKKGLSLFEKGIYAGAEEHFQTFLNTDPLAYESNHSAMRTKAELLIAQCAVRLGRDGGEKQMLDFVKAHQPDPIADQAIFELADYFYANRKYKEAAKYFDRINVNTLTDEEKAEALFKHGYVLFVQKEFKLAQSKLGQIRNTPSEYYEPSNYYYGMSSYFLEDDDEAIEAWRKIQRSKRYQKTIPYYIAQIYFRKKEYDELIAYANPLIADPAIKNQVELQQLIGQAHYEKGDFEKALPYLEYYEQNSRQLRKEDFYQLAYLQYQLEKFEAAIPNFQELNDLDEPMGQSAMYYLADCFLKVDNKAAARNAFQLAARMKYDPELQEDALFQFAKLSAEQGFDRQAINALSLFLPESKYYSDAQQLMSQVLVNTKDYTTAIEIIQKMDNRSPTMKETYQRVSYQLAIQAYNQNDIPKSMEYLNMSLEDPIDMRTQALATFWKGDIQHLQKKYAVSNGTLTVFQQQAASFNDLPANSGMGTSFYIQGYNALKLKDYQQAYDYYDKAIVFLERSPDDRPEWAEKRSRLISDSYLRGGDCLFKQKQYTKAKAFYDRAINAQAVGYEYAIFQKAIISGLVGKIQQKTQLLNQVAQDFPNSKFSDDALLELGRTYQNEGQFENALYPLELLVNRYKGKSTLVNRAYIQIGLIYYNLDNPQKALDNYKEVFKHNPSSIEAKEALTAIEEIYVSDLSDPRGYVAFVESLPGYKVSDGAKDSLQFQVAERLYETGEYQRAIAAYTEYINQYPDGFYQLVSRYHRGESASILKQFDTAIKDYEYLINLGESNYYQDALSKAALISYNYQEDFTKSFKYYEQLEALLVDGQSKFDAQLGAMRSAFRIGNFKAVETYANKVQSNSFASASEKATASFFLGKLALENERYQAATNYFTSALEQLDNEFAAEARYSLAYIAYVQRDIPKADELARKSYSESSAYPFWVAKSLILLSDVLVAQKDLFNARAALEAVIDNFTEDEELVNEAKQKLQGIEKLEAKQNRLLPENSSKNLILDNGPNKK